MNLTLLKAKTKEVFKSNLLALVSEFAVQMSNFVFEELKLVFF